MSGDWFTALTGALTGPYFPAFFAAVLWGVIGILLSPCHISSIPLIVGYMNRGNALVQPRQAFRFSLAFSVGILGTILLVGVVTAYLGRMLGDIGTAGIWIMGLLLVAIGLYLMDVVPLHWGGFPVLKTAPRGVAGALALGLLFGIGLGPCTFAFLAPVLAMVFQSAQTELSRAYILLIGFSIGHTAAIVLAGTLAGWVQRYLNWQQESRGVGFIKRICGGLVAIGGIYLIYAYAL